MRKGRKLLKSNRGTTMAELIVTFVLISLFMVAATRVIANTVAIYYRAKGITTGMQVSSIISTKVRDVIEGALAAPLVDGATGSATVYMKLSDDGIEFTDYSGRHALAKSIQDGTSTNETPKYMELYYYPVASEEDPSGGTPQVSDMTWTFDKKAYMGYYVKELTFEQAGSEYEKNIIKMTLVLSSTQYGDYSTTTYIECYNFKGGDRDLIVTN